MSHTNCLAVGYEPGHHMFDNGGGGRLLVELMSWFPLNGAIILPTRSELESQASCGLLVTYCNKATYK